MLHSFADEQSKHIFTQSLLVFPVSFAWQRPSVPDGDVAKRGVLKSTATILQS